MPDISLRFNKDMIALTPPAVDYLCTGDEEDALHACLVGLLEPETLEHVYRMIMATGAQCVTAATAAFTPARLRMLGMECYAEALARNALDAAHTFSPQHVLLEAAPCGLPLDPASKADLKEYCAQYAAFGRLFEHLNKENTGEAARTLDASSSGADIMPSLTLSNNDIDGYLLSGFDSLTELKCALMGLRKVTDRPVFTSLRFDENGLTPMDSASIEDTARACEDLESAVFGLEVSLRKTADIEWVLALIKRCKTACSLPLFVDLEIRNSEGSNSKDGFSGIEPDYMFDFGLAFHKAGVQFIRASGKATLAHTAVLAASITGLNTVL